ncbi:class I adenylate-forming enzyme family protein [Kribbella solani]|uniref:Acyl-CoA synthetase (AMP-forming)/AMP-acid ligase II n=1 Tax=Kribbella solani TaxID=236067 RepID=A0A841E402_9ACTN|nr:class I adenylate-forming enzyme family protein [Kribbella solani]MBB5983725.1 acyl-CoA synthetase (AMP-forming)/AMP-acid ligase II [Kribbella solani]
MTIPVLPRISDYVGHWAGIHPEREALVGDSVRWTYRELQAEVDAIAAALVGQGVGRGDRVALLGRTRPECFAHFLATASIGAIWVGLNPRYTLDEITAILADSRPRLVFSMIEPSETGFAELLGGISEQTGPSVPLITRGDAGPGISTGWAAFLAAGTDRSSLDVARKAVEPHDAAAMIYTSGTTGKSKGALVPHVGLSSCGVIQTSRWYGDAPRKLCDLPLNHIGGLGDICTSILTAGGTVVFMAKFDAAGALRMVERERLTHLYYIPTQLLAAVETPEWETCDLSSLEWILWGGAAAPLGLLERLAQKGAKLGTSYSLTESTGSVTYTEPDDPLDVLAWSVGRIDPRYEVTIRRADGSTANDGEEGEILIRGEHITLGYFGRPEATREAIDADGWLHTGDLARIEPNGHVRLAGRLKEMYKSGGYNVYPREIESVLEQHPGVSLASVVGVPDDRWGEVGHAFVVAGDVSADELETFLAERLANYKRPKRLWLEQSLPRLPIGKVDKAALRRRIAAEPKPTSRENR